MLALCSMTLLSCSTAKGSLSGKADEQAIISALEKNQVNISMLNFSRFGNTNYYDISGGSYYISIMGEKAKGTIPILETPENPASETYNIISSTNEFNVEKLPVKSGDKSVTYILTSPYGKIGYKVKVICYYTGVATVIFDSNYATKATVKINSKIELPTTNTK